MSLGYWKTWPCTSEVSHQCWEESGLANSGVFLDRDPNPSPKTRAVTYSVATVLQVEQELFWSLIIQPSLSWESPFLTLINTGSFSLTAFEGSGFCLHMMSEKIWLIFFLFSLLIYLIISPTAVYSSCRRRLVIFASYILLEGTWDKDLCRIQICWLCCISLNGNRMSMMLQFQMHVFTHKTKTVLNSDNLTSNTV